MGVGVAKGIEAMRAADRKKTFECLGVEVNRRSKPIDGLMALNLAQSRLVRPTVKLVGPGQKGLVIEDEAGQAAFLGAGGDVGGGEEGVVRADTGVAGQVRQVHGGGDTRVADVG